LTAPAELSFELTYLSNPLEAWLWIMLRPALLCTGTGGPPGIFSIMNNATPVARGCGSRERGGVYAEVGFSENGSPLEDFLLDPPELLDVAKLGISPRGTTLIPHGKLFHLVDWVGSKFYPNVADYLEEARRFGISRRLAKNLDFSKLTPGSRIILLHSRAYVEPASFKGFADSWNYREQEMEGHPRPRCPKCIEAHDQEEAPALCAGFFWQDIEGGAPVEGQPNPRLVEVSMPSFSYHAYARPDGHVPDYRPAAFASFPISRLVGIRDTAAVDEDTRRVLSKSTLPTELEDE
jgi:hypothetical protein